MWKPPVQPGSAPGPAGAAAGGHAPTRRPAEGGFDAALERVIARERIRISRHARERMVSRGIGLTGDEIRRIGRAIDTLRDKGAGVSLVMMPGKAFVTNVRNRTLITAIDAYGAQDKVFTQIDSAVFVDTA